MRGRAPPAPREVPARERPYMGRDTVRYHYHRGAPRLGREAQRTQLGQHGSASAARITVEEVARAVGRGRAAV